MRGPKPKYPIQLTIEEEQALQRLVRARTTPQGKVRRARIILLANAHPEVTTNVLDFRPRKATKARSFSKTRRKNKGKTSCLRFSSYLRGKKRWRDLSSYGDSMNCPCFVTANVLDFRPPKATKARSFSKTRRKNQGKYVVPWLFFVAKNGGDTLAVTLFLRLLCFVVD